MNCHRLFAVILVLINLKASSQNRLKGDYADAVTLSINQKYVFKNSATGFGHQQEFPQKKIRLGYLFEKERNTCWFSLNIEEDGFLTFDIVPFSAQDDYDWMLFRETPVNATDSKINYNKPVRTNNSRNDGSILGRTGLKDGFNNLFTNPGPGKSYSKPVEVRKGENYILVIDNIYPGGEGFTFTSAIQQTLPSQISKPVIVGKITDKESMHPLRAEMLVEDSVGTTILSSVSDSLTGQFSFKAPKNSSTICINKKGYALLNDFLPLGKDSLHQDYQLQKLKSGAKIIFYNIHFLPNSAAIVNASGADVNRLLTFLKAEKDWKIQIIGHTNANVFTDEHYLQQLSERRAWAVKKVLLEQGISTERMRCFGLGGKHPLYDNKKPEEAIKNLRVEVVLER